MSRKLAFFTSSFLVMVSVSTAWSGGIVTPFTFDSTAVLPKGVRSVRVLGFTTELENRWDGSGGFEPLANRMNKSITYGELVEAQRTVDERAQLKGYLLSKNISMSSIVGESHGIVNTRLTSTVPVAAYGVTERLTVAVIVPVLYSKINIATGWTSNENLQAALDGLSAEGKHNKKMSFEQKLLNVVQTKVTSFGYDTLDNETRQEMGDITLGAKYLLSKSDDWSVVLSPRLVLPTGRESTVTKLIDVAPGDGQWDIGLGTTAEYTANGNLSFLGTLNAVVQLPHRRAKRIPYKRWESPTPDIDYDVEEKLGDLYGAIVGTKYRFAEVWSLSGQYSAQYKSPDEVRGSRFEQERYKWLSDDTEQVLQALQAGLTFSTIPLFKTGRFAAPLETTLSVATSIGGRNTPQTTLAAWELALFF